MTLETLAGQLRKMAENLEGCASDGGDMTSMIDINDGLCNGGDVRAVEDREWVQVQQIGRVFPGEAELLHHFWPAGE